MELKAFLSHRHCTTLSEMWWRGGYAGAGSTVIKADEPYYATYAIANRTEGLTAWHPL